ncbi:hypothetical protein PybrP1_007524 [[Pythium] brassicae (nom. inval.)]|nr:hypothetical protein PybrP1_007524 [[Pythium] brassicae (nom. inval.)]
MKRWSPGKKLSAGVVSVRKSHDGGLLGTLRRILQRKKATPVNADIDQAGAHQLRAPSSDAAPVAQAKALPLVKKNEDRNEDDDNDEDSGDDSDQDGDAGDNSLTGQRPSQSKGKRAAPKRGKNRWVRQLLNQVEKKKDRVHVKARKHRRLPAASPGGVRLAPPAPFTAAGSFNSLLVARILLFLDVREPAAIAALVNKACSAHVRAFYEVHCLHPRPQRYLAKKLFNTATSGHDTVRRSEIPKTVLSFLSVPERVRASSCCRVLYDSCNVLPLIISGAEQARRFVDCMSPEFAQARFVATTQLRLEDMDAECAATVVSLLDTGECECFPALSELSLIRVRDFAVAEKLFMQFIQVLFTDRVSHKLQTLELSDMAFEDLHFRHLARLFYDARFPLLRRVVLSRNRFSSRFMRDWSRSFANYRFRRLQSLDVADVAMTDEDTQRFVACLENTPTLLQLRISNNLFSSTALALLSQQIARGSLRNLTEFECSAITADANDLGVFVDALRGRSECGCRLLTKMNMSGNPVSSPQARLKLARVFVPLLNSGSMLYDADMGIGESGFEMFADALRSAPASAISHLDVSGNTIGRAMHSFSQCLLTHALRKLRFLALAETLLLPTRSQGGRSCCPQLQQLNVSRNLDLRSVVKYQEASNQSGIGYAQTFKEVQERNLAKVTRIEARCKRQCRLLRARYDHLEGEADRALRRRKKIRKSPHLMLHQEIRRLKQEKYHRELCRVLAAS